MIKKLLIPIFIFTVVTGYIDVCAKEVSPLQLLYLVKMSFPNKKSVELFITQEELKEKKASIERAGTQMQLQVNVHLIEKATDIGKAFDKIAEDAVLIVSNDDVLNKNATKLYILSKCKDNKIALFATSKDYGDSGALLCVYIDENDEIKVILNLTKNTHLKNKFTEEVIQKAGIQEVIM